MKVYDASWARNVYSTYSKLWPRTQQMDACIRETIRQIHGRMVSGECLTNVFIADIQHGNGNRLWRLYKRLNKRTPLDKMLLEQVSNGVYYSIEQIDVDLKQRQFAWD